MISDDAMEHLKNLARLALSEEETLAMKEDISKLLVYFDQLQELDTEGLEPLARPVEVNNVFRADKQGESLSQTSALTVALEQEEGMYKVPRTVD